MTFEGKTIMISGASSGIGHALSLEMARRGAKHIVILARRLPALESLAEELKELDCNPFPISCDVGNDEAVVQAVAIATEALGNIDIVIANAGMGSTLSAFEPDLKAIQAITNVNFLGAVRLIHAVLPDMIARHSGHIVGISSLASLRGMPRGAGYCASKAALNAFLESYRVELDLIGIPVSTVYPGYVRTPIQENTDVQPKFMIEADVAARIIADGVERNKKDIRFPFIPSVFMTLLSMAPPWIFDRVTQFMARARLKPPPRALPPGNE